MSAAPTVSRIVFFGTAAFAVPSLQRLASNGRFEIAAVVTQPDRPSGRGRAASPSPVKSAAQALNIEVLQPERIRSASFCASLRAFDPAFFVVAAYGRILPPSLLAVPRLGPVNIHGSLLPEYRGAAPIQRALIDGCPVTGVTSMLMTSELDAGDVLMQASYPVGPEDNAETVTMALAALGADLIVETLCGLIENRIRPVPQDHARATYAPPITSDDAVLDWSRPAAAIVNRIRAMSPRPGALTAYEGRSLKVLRASVWHSDGAGEPGRVVSLPREGVVVVTGLGSVLIRDVVPEGRRQMTAAEWARGARLAVGSALALMPPPRPAPGPRSATA